MLERGVQGGREGLGDRGELGLGGEVSRLDSSPSGSYSFSKIETDDRFRSRFGHVLLQVLHQASLLLSLGIREGNCLRFVSLSLPFLSLVTLS